MTARSRIGLGLTVLAVGAAIAPVVPASGAGFVLPGGPSPVAPRVDDVGGSAGGPGGPRDGSAAVPFVAYVGPDQGSGGEGFDWGDAALGALAGGLLVLLAHRVGPGSPSRVGSTVGGQMGNKRRSRGGRITPKSAFKGTIGFLVLAAMVLAAPAMGGEVDRKPGQHKPKPPKPRPNLDITSTKIRGPEYVFRDGARGTLHWRGVVENKGKATSRGTQMRLKLVPRNATGNPKLLSLSFEPRKVPALKPGHSHRARGSDIMHNLPLGSYWVLVCVQEDRCAYTGRHLYVVNETWTGTVTGFGGAGGIARSESWGNVGPVSLNFDNYRGRGVFSYTFAGTVKWTDAGTNMNGCQRSGTGLKNFDKTSSGPGIVLRYDHGDYRGVVGSLEEDFYTILITDLGLGFPCSRKSIPGPAYEDFLTIGGKQALKFDQDELRGSFGSGLAEAPQWNWAFK